MASESTGCAAVSGTACPAGAAAVVSGCAAVATLSFDNVSAASAPPFTVRAGKFPFRPPCASVQKELPTKKNIAIFVFNRIQSYSMSLNDCKITQIPLTARHFR